MNHERLKKNTDFARVYKQGKSYANKTLVLYYLPNHQDLSRIGFSVSKKVGNAVVRNRIRRLMKESLRTLPMLPKGYDLVLIARNQSAQLSYSQMKESIRYLLKKSILAKPLSSVKARG